MVRSTLGWLTDNSFGWWPLVITGVITCLGAIGLITNGRTYAQQETLRKNFGKTIAPMRPALKSRGQFAQSFPMRGVAQVNGYPKSFPGTAAYVNVAPNQASTLLAAELRMQEAEQRDPEQIERLRNMLEKEFDARHQEQVERLDEVLAQAKRTGAILDRREDEKEKIIDRRLTEMLGGRDPMQWNYQPGLPQARAGIPNVFTPDRTTTSWAEAIPLDRSAKPLASPPSPPGVPRFSATSPDKPIEAPAAAVGLAAREPATSARMGRTYIQGQALAPTPKDKSISIAPQHMITIGFQIQSLMAEREKMQRLADKAVVPLSETRKAETALQAARAQWDFAKRELMNEIEIAQIEISAQERLLQANLTFLERARENDPEDLSQATREVRKEVQETEKEIRIARLWLRQLSERLTWMEQFEKELDEPDPGADESATNAGNLRSDGNSKSREVEDSATETIQSSRPKSDESDQG